MSKRLVSKGILYAFANFLEVIGKGKPTAVLAGWLLGRRRRHRDDGGAIMAIFRHPGAFLAADPAPILVRQRTAGEEDAA